MLTFTRAFPFAIAEKTCQAHAVKTNDQNTRRKVRAAVSYYIYRLMRWADCAALPVKWPSNCIRGTNRQTCGLFWLDFDSGRARFFR